MRKKSLLLIGIVMSMLLSGCKSNNTIETSVAETVDKYAVNAEIDVNNSSGIEMNEANQSKGNVDSNNSNSVESDKDNSLDSVGSAWERESLANKALDESIALEESSIAAEELNAEPIDIYGIYERTEGSNIIVSLFNNDTTIEYSIDSTQITGGVDELNSKDEILIVCKGVFDEESKIIKDVSKIVNYTKQLEEERKLDGEIEEEEELEELELHTSDNEQNN